MENEKMIINRAILELNKRLGVVISILLRMMPKDGLGISLKEQVKTLDNLGMRPRDIAEILGRTQSHITKELTGLRKEKNRKHDQKQEK